MKKYLSPLLWVVGFQVISTVISMVTRANMGWYDTLEKSSLTPPGIVFGIVWTVLYVLLALAAWKIWSARKEPHARIPLILFAVQMALNWAWSFVFFAAQDIALGFLWIVVLDAAMIAFVSSAWSRYRIAAALVIPTILWGSFAAYLNYTIWILN